MSLVELLICGCRPGFVYASKCTFANHKKSVRHQNWEMRDRVNDLQKRAVRLENEKLAKDLEKEIVYIIRDPGASTRVKVGRTSNSGISALRKRYQTSLGKDFRILYWRVEDSKQMELDFGEKFTGTKITGELFDSAFLHQYVAHFSKLTGSDW